MTVSTYGFILLLGVDALVYIAMTCHIITVFDNSRIKVLEEDLPGCMHIPTCTDSSQTGNKTADIPINRY